MHRVIKVGEVTEPFLVVSSLPVVAEDEEARKKAPTLDIHLKDIDSAGPFDEPENQCGNNDDRIGYGIKESLVTRAACPFAHIDFNIRGGLGRSVEEIVHDLWSEVDAKKHDKSINGITASQEEREERRPLTGHLVESGVPFAQVTGIAQTDIGKRNDSQKFHRGLLVLNEIDE